MSAQRQAFRFGLNNNPDTADDRSSAPELARCPYCGAPAGYRVTFFETDFNDVYGTGLPRLARRTEVIECTNTMCPVLPRLIRIESDDAVRIWNTRVIQGRGE